MLDPESLYELTGDAGGLGAPVLVQALTGFVDAGGAARLAREHLLATSGHRELVRFDLDQLLDYRSRRPTMLFVRDHWESYDRPSLALHVLHDRAGTPFLLLAGPEPDFQWDRFSAAVRGLVARLGVRLTVGLHSIPMAVPHTRPTGVTAHATRRELIAGYEPWLQSVRVPGSAGHLLEFELGREGRDAVGFAAHVPHYLAQTDYPAAAETLLAAVARTTGLDLPPDALHAQAVEMRATIDAQVARSEEVQALVRALEEQYDTYLRGRQGENLLAPEAGPLPTAEELGAELERFLAEQARRDGEDR